MHPALRHPRCVLGVVFGTLFALFPAVAHGAPAPSHAFDWTRVATELVGDADPGPGRVVAASPVPAEARISSDYGMRPGRTTGRATFHAGIDFVSPRGTPVYAVRSGRVATVAYDRRHRPTPFGGYGNAIVVYHGELDQWSFYAHLDELEIEEGQRVVAGQMIGRVGNTSNGRFPGMGVHLHFEVRDRAADGDAPFPGPYGRHNRDPRAWLASQGVHYDRDGTLDPAPMVLPSSVRYAVAVRHLIGLDVPFGRAPHLAIEPRSMAACTDAIASSVPSRHPDPWYELSAALSCLVPIREREARRVAL